MEYVTIFFLGCKNLQSILLTFWVDKFRLFPYYLIMKIVPVFIDLIMISAIEMYFQNSLNSKKSLVFCLISLL